MNRLLFKNLRLFYALVGCILLCNCVLAQSSSSAQIVNPSWTSNTYSVGMGDTVGTHDGKLAFSINLSDLDGTDSFSIVLTDEDDNVVMNIGEYMMKKHENGFYYVEEKSSHELRTVFGNDVYFLTPIKQDKLSKIKRMSLKVKSKPTDKSNSSIEKTIKTKVPKFKKS